MEILLILCTGLVNVLCFLIGARVGQKVSKEEEIEVPKLNPMQIYREKQEKKETSKERDKLEAIMHNIDAYDGTGNGQRDIPV